MTKKIDYYEKSETINENGEVLETEKITSLRIPSEDDYIKLYIKDISYLNDLEKNSDKLIYELLNYLNYRNEIVLNGAIKKRIAENLNYKSIQQINNKLSYLTKKGILDRVENGIYLINPFLFGKGKWSDILKLRNQNLHLEIEYDSKTNSRIIKSKISKQSSMKFDD